MQLTKSDQTSGLLEQFIGEHSSVVSTRALPVNNYIQANKHVVYGADFSHSEDTGVLYSFPDANNCYGLELYYLRNSETNDMHNVVYSFRYLPAFLSQYPATVSIGNQSFHFRQQQQLQFPVCSKSRSLLSQLDVDHTQSDFLNSLKYSEVLMQLLGRALECITVPFMACQVPACRFLAFETERDKVKDACTILDQNTDQPITITDLARRVAMNECYLKKGFKAMTGKTIHEYQQDIRIGRAKELLTTQGLSVTAVANVLGYSSISHFSTAFKRVTGMKPCELLA